MLMLHERDKRTAMFMKGTFRDMPGTLEGFVLKMFLHGFSCESKEEQFVGTI
jgi:hypothetical protein